MSREIKFRAWDIPHKCYRDVESICSDGSVMVYLPPCDDRMLLDPENVVIEQYTGLKDKNGKEIYEGDIVKDTEKDVLREIRWDELWAAFIAIRIGLSLDTALYRSKEHFIIVGNIHENNRK